MATILDLAQKTLRGELPPPPVGRLLGFVLKEVEPGRAVFEMEADERHHNPMGTLHGGIYCDLADAAMGFAYAATLGEGEAFTTIELKINFLRPVRRTTLTAEAKVVKAGSSVLLGNVLAVGDGVAVTEEDAISVQATVPSEVLLFDLA